MVEQRCRSIVKTLSWRITGTIATTLISFLITGSFAFALSIGTFEFIAKMFLYYFHERLWNRINLGRTAPKNDYQI